MVDLKSDGHHAWLTSRLYLFTYVLSRMKGVRSVMFTATRGDMSRSFVGVATTGDLMRALAAAEPWFRLAMWQVEAHQVGWLTTLAQPSQPPLPAAPAAPAADPWVPPDVDDWWQAMRTNPTLADPLHIALAADLDQR